MTRPLPALFALACCLALPQQTQAQTFTVRNALGQAEIGKDRSAYQPAAVNSNYAIPSWGKTEDNSSLTITFNPQNTFRLLPDSEAEVTTGGDSDSNSAWHRVVSLKIGKASFDHNTGAAPALHLDCETPTAVCGAVGTEFDVDATAGTYKVGSGRISVYSSKEGDSLKIPRVDAGGSVTYAPGRENTYSHGSFSGTVVIGGNTFHASDATFTVAKLAGSGSEIAVHISSGSLSGVGPGSYLMDGGSLKPATGEAAAIHPQYLAAAQEEGSLNVKRAADQAANRPFGQEAALASATARATELRKKLFTRETIREVNKEIIQNVIQNTTRNAAAAGMRGGH